MVNNIDISFLSNIENLIEVKKPYFALESLHLDNNQWLCAKVPIQCQRSYEKTLMDASEVGRHLAILGSCFGALINPKKSRHYYLAYQAQLNTYESYISANRPNYLYARAIGKFINQRELYAEMELIDISGNITARLLVNYHVIKEKSFNKIYSNHVNEVITPINNRNPYNTSVNLEIVHLDDKTLIASIGEVDSEMCLGHFEKVKALPVAILSQCFLNSSYIFLNHIIGKNNIDFVLKSCDLRAEKLAISGQYVNIHVQFISKNNNSFITKCIAKNQLGQVVGEMDCYIDQV